MAPTREEKRRSLSKGGFAEAGLCVRVWILGWNGGGCFFIKCVVDVPRAGSECVGRIFFLSCFLDDHGCDQAVGRYVGRLAGG